MLDYALASSGCYRLPSGPFSDDSIGITYPSATQRSARLPHRNSPKVHSAAPCTKHFSTRGGG